MFGGPWSYDDEPQGEPSGEDAEWLAEASSSAGAVVGGRATYEAAGHWGDENPFGLPFFIVTHRPEEEPESGDFPFVSGVGEAVDAGARGRGDKDVNLMGGADVIRQALDAGLVDELTIIVAPVILGEGSETYSPDGRPPPAIARAPGGLMVWSTRSSIDLSTSASSLAGVRTRHSVTLAYTHDAEPALRQDAQDRPAQHTTEIVVSWFESGSRRPLYTGSCGSGCQAVFLNDPSVARRDISGPRYSRSAADAGVSSF